LNFNKKTNLRVKIIVQLKTFYGKKLTYQIEVNINDPLYSISNALLRVEELVLTEFDEKWIYNNQFRLVTTSKYKIKELNLMKSYAEEEVEQFQTLILLPQKDIFFSEYHIGANVFLENNNSTAMKVGSDDHQIIMCDQGFKTGRHYVEFSFLTEPVEKSIVIGVCLSRSDFFINMKDPKGLWGFIPSEGSKIGPNKEHLEKFVYGETCKIGDNVGILLEFEDKGLQLTLFINKKSMGVAFSGLSLDTTYFPCAILGLDSSKVYLNPQSCLP